MDDVQPTSTPRAGTTRRTFLAQTAGVGATLLLASGQGKSQPEPATPAPATKPIIARCGYRCDLCAARSEDPAVRQKLVDGWRKYFGHTQYTAENVKCGGCFSEQRADQTCKVRPCVIEKKLDNCGQCKECPCDKLKPLCASSHIYFLQFRDVPHEDYDLCLRQFENIPELMSIREKTRKGR